MARALTIAGRGEQPSIQDLPVPDPGPGQVRVRVLAASINGIDAFAAVGDGVSNVAVGDMVMGVVTALDLPVARTFALDDAASAVGAFGSATLGKLVVTNS